MMKKYIKSLLVFCSVFTLASCSGQNTPTEPEENLTNFEKGLKKAKESVSLAGQLTQTRKFYSSATFQSPTGAADETSNSNLSFTFSNDGFSRTVEVEDATSGNLVPYLSETYFKDENGHAYTESLSYKNEVIKNYYTDDKGNFTTFYQAGFENPFSFVEASDFTKKEDGTYEFNKDKASSFMSYLCYFFSTGVINPPSSVTVNFNSNDELTNLVYIPTVRYVDEYNSIQDSHTYYTIDQTFTFVVTGLGNSNIEHLKPVESNSNFADLDIAFKNTDLKNSTVTISVDQGGTVKSKKLYLDGENVYVQSFDGSNAGNKVDPTNDYLLRKNKGGTYYEAYGYDTGIKKWIPSNKTKFGKLSQDKYVYTDLTPTFNGLSSKLFSFDEKSNSYVTENKNALKSIVSNLILPVASELSYTYLKYANKISISLNGDNIRNVKIDYSYNDSFITGTVVSGQITILYRSIGTTKLPFDALNNLGE